MVEVKTMTTTVPLYLFPKTFMKKEKQKKGTENNGKAINKDINK